MIKKLMSIVALLVVASMLLTACGAPATPTEAPAAPAATNVPAAAAATEAPAAAPAVDPLAALVEASKNEKDGLLVYSNMGENNWKPVVAAFNAKYPWITVTTLDLGTTEGFERYYTESAGGARTGDMIVTTAPDGWQDFIAKDGLEVYNPSSSAGLPDFAKLADGVWAISTDPMIIIWNKSLVPTPVTSMADVVKLAENPANKGKITTYDAEKNGTGFAINWFWANKNGDEGWKMLETLGKAAPSMQTSAGNMVKAVLSGEAVVGYFVSGISVFPKFPDAEPVMGWSYDKGGQIVIVRGMGLTKKASSPASAKLMMEFVLTSEGQLAWSDGGLTPYRPDVADKATYHLQKIIDAVGADHIIYSYFDPNIASAENRSAFVAKWKTALGRP